MRPQPPSSNPMGFSCSQALGECEACPLADVLSSLFLFSSLSASLHCSLQSCLGKSCWSCYMTRSSHFLPPHYGQNIFKWFCVALAWTCMLVIWVLWGRRRILCKSLISNACIFFCRSAVIIHVSQALGNVAASGKCKSDLGADCDVTVIPGGSQFYKCCCSLCWNGNQVLIILLTLLPIGTLNLELSSFSSLMVILVLMLLVYGYLIISSVFSVLISMLQPAELLMRRTAKLAVAPVLSPLIFWSLLQGISW